MSGYERQDRGSDSAYDQYLRGMDASMRQKVALTAAHLLCEGQIADMGMGSGSGSHALAALYPDLEVIGVDVDPEMVRRASERYRLPNLRFLQGDIATPCFASGTLEAILDSSVLHHVTSYGGYDRAAAERAMAVQVEQLAPGGVLIVRDFVDPGAGEVWLDLPADDHQGEHDGDDPISCSSAALFERFAREFRILQPAGDRGFPFRRLEGSERCPLHDGWRRYAVSHTIAAEFILRKDYRDSWAVEVQEEYTYATQADLEAICARLGLRVLASTPLHNPWIVNHRFRDKLRLWRETERGAESLDFPPTNIVIVGQKVPSGEGVRFVQRELLEPSGYLELSHYRRDDGLVYDLARRPGVSFDVLPWFAEGGRLYVLARRSYPRPVLACDEPRWTPIDGASPPHYVTEPLNVQQRDKPLGQTVEELLATFPDLGADALRGFDEGTTYYPSPGGIQEEVRSVLVEVQPTNVQTRIRGASGFSTSGTLRALEARQLLRAAQVGGLPDARLELNTDELLLRRKADAGEWIGEAMVLSDGKPPARALSLKQLAQRPHRRRFHRATASESSGFLELRRAAFAELDTEGNEVARQPRELVLARPLSLNTVVVAPLRRSGDTVYLGLDDDDLPAAQCFHGNSELLVAPAWRVPHEVTGNEATRAWIRERLELEYGVRCGRLWELGGRYHPSAGLTPEVVYPLAAELTEASAGERALTWVDLRDALEQRHQLRDGHLLIVTLRAAHALGLYASLHTASSMPLGSSN